MVRTFEAEQNGGFVVDQAEFPASTCRSAHLSGPSPATSISSWRLPSWIKDVRAGRAPAGWRVQIAARASRKDDRTELRIWQEYSAELDDDYYGVCSFNWGVLAREPSPRVRYRVSVNRSFYRISR
jgi:hypothetical protein